MRCYDGCPDSELQAVIDAEYAAEQRLRELCPEAHCTYFPSPGVYQVWVNNAPVGGWSHDKSFNSRLDALTDAITIFERG